MNRRKEEFYKCYSYNLKNFINAHGVYSVSSGVNPKTNNVYHIFMLNDELSKILTAWTRKKEMNK